MRYLTFVILAACPRSPSFPKDDPASPPEADSTDADSADSAGGPTVESGFSETADTARATDTGGSTAETGSPGETAETGLTGTETGARSETGHLGDTAPTDTGFRSVPPAGVEWGPLVVCEDPSARSLLRFDEVELSLNLVSDEQLWGGGLVAVDLDLDGAIELILLREAGQQVFSWDGSGWVDQTEERWAAPPLAFATSGSAADYDGDGDLDLVVVSWQRRPQLFRNDGGVLTEVTSEARFPDRPLRYQGSSWGDWDGDGDLDLMLSAYGSAPVVDPLAPDVDPNLLLLNLGDGTFQDWSFLLPPEASLGFTFLSSWMDLNLDGTPELFVMHDFPWIQPTVLLQRFGTGLRVDGSSGFLPSFCSMGATFGDINGDLLPDVALTSYNRVGLMQSYPFLPALSDVAWSDWAAAMGVSADLRRDQVFGWGIEFADLDHDTDLDLAINFGAWSTFDPRVPMDDSLFLREGARFVDRAREAAWSFADAGNARGLLAVDVDRNGWIDLVKRRLNGPDVVYTSRCGEAHWSMIELRDEGFPNRFGVGAQVRVTADGLTQARWILAGSHSLYVGGPPEAHFGLGTSERLESVEVIWPDGARTVVDDLPVDRRLTITR